MRINPPHHYVFIINFVCAYTSNETPAPKTWQLHINLHNKFSIVKSDKFHIALALLYPWLSWDIGPKTRFAKNKDHLRTIVPFTNVNEQYCIQQSWSFAKSTDAVRWGSGGGGILMPNTLALACVIACLLNHVRTVLLPLLSSLLHLYFRHASNGVTDSPCLGRCNSEKCLKRHRHESW